MLASLQAKDLARLEECARPIQPFTASHSKKDICLYKDPAPHAGLVQLQDKIVDRFALTIYPYSLAHLISDLLISYKTLPFRGRSIGQDYLVYPGKFGYKKCGLLCR